MEILIKIYLYQSSYNFRYVIFNTLYPIEKQKDIINNYEYDDTSLKKYFKINNVSINGKIINAMILQNMTYYMSQKKLY